MRAEMAKSLSGHDKNQFYVILKKEGKFSYLVNGTTHGINNPKKKSEKHYQIIKCIPKEIEETLDGEWTDISVRKAVKAYEKHKINS